MPTAASSTSAFDIAPMHLIPRGGTLEVEAWLPNKDVGFVEPGQRAEVKVETFPFVSDLRNPPGNRLEKLTGDRTGQWSIRINQQWRLCFVWRNDAAWDVAIVDYH